MTFFIILQVDADSDDDDPTWTLVSFSIFFLSVAHTISSFILLLSYFSLKLPVLLFKKEKDISRNLLETEWLREIFGVEKFLTYDFLSNVPEHWARLAIQSSRFPRFFHARQVKKEAILLGLLWYLVYWCLKKRNLKARLFFIVVQK